jgi:glucose/arabinose dehydrogenase
MAVRGLEVSQVLYFQAVGQAKPTPTASAIPALIRTSVNGTMSAKVDVIATLGEPYCVAELPDGRFLVTEAHGGIKLVNRNGNVGPTLTGVPANFGFPFDVVLAPDFALTHRIFFSNIESGPDHAPNGVNDGLRNGDGVAVAFATLLISGTSTGDLTGAKVIWRQDRRGQPRGEQGGKLLFSKEGRYLFIASGDRSSFLAQDAATNLGKIVRIFPDGSIPHDNPLVGKAGAKPDIWTVGHRNQYGLAFDAAGRLWEHENGPAGGDALNLLKPGLNYGWPAASWGNHYDGSLIPKFAPGDGFEAPSKYWIPDIAPSGFIIYNGLQFPALNGLGIIGWIAVERPHPSQVGNSRKPRG